LLVRAQDFYKNPSGNSVLTSTLQFTKSTTAIESSAHTSIDSDQAQPKSTGDLYVASHGDELGSFSDVESEQVRATRVTQFLIVHYLLTRSWMEDTVADQLSLVREPQRVKQHHSASNSVANINNVAANNTSISSAIGSTTTLVSTSASGGGSAQGSQVKSESLQRHTSSNTRWGGSVIGHTRQQHSTSDAERHRTATETKQNQDPGTLSSTEQSSEAPTKRPPILRRRSSKANLHRTRGPESADETEAEGRGN
jgi:hypothetical protein